MVSTPKKYKSDKFYWCGSGQCYDRRNGVLHYKSFTKEKLTVNIKDYVLIRSDDYSDSENLSNCYVAQVEDLFDIGDDEKDRYKAEVQWFMRLDELPPRHQKRLQEPDYKREVVKCIATEKYDTVIDAETIFGKCSVIMLSPDVMPYMIWENNDSAGLPIFCCRWSYDGHKFLPAKNSSNGSPETFKSDIAEPTSARSLRSSKKFKDSDDFESEASSLSNEVCFLTPQRKHNYGTRSKNKNLAPVSNSRIAKESLSRKKMQGSFNLSDLTIGEIRKFSRIKLRRASSSEEEMSPNSGAKSSHFTEKGSRIVSTSKQKVARNLEKSFSEDCGNNLQALEGEERNKMDFLLTFHKKSPKRSLLPNNYESNEQSTKSRKRITSDDAENKELSFEEKAFQTTQKSNNLSRLKSEDLEHHVVITRSGRKVKLQKQFSFFNSPEKSPRLGRMPERRSAGGVGHRLLKDSTLSDDSDGDDSFQVEESSDSDSEGSSEDEDFIKSKKTTPRRSQNGVTNFGRRKRNCKKSPKSLNRSSKKNKKNSVTSTMQLAKRIAPCMVSTPLAEARARLHVSAVPEKLPYREQEFKHIYSFVKGKLCDGTGGCMYICGVSGTGKTATVRNVVSALERRRKSEAVPEFQFIEINGMKLTDPNQCYVRLLKELSGEKMAATQAEEALHKQFSNSQARKNSIVLLVDEVDLLWTPKRKVLYNLFDWLTRPHSKLIVLAISNTMNLLEKMKMHNISSRLGETRVTFLPYNWKQLQEIIAARLTGLKAFDPDAVLLVARKVAAPLLGDVRKALNICRRAAEIAESSESKKAASSLVTMTHIEKAWEEIFESLHVKAIRFATKHEKLFLRAVVSDFRESRSEETTFSRVYSQYCALCRFEGTSPLNTTEVASIYSRLSSCGLLSSGNGKLDFRKIYLNNVSVDDVNFGLQNAEGDLI